MIEEVCLPAVILAFARGWAGSAWECLTPSAGLPRSAPVCPGLPRLNSKNRDLIDRLQTSASWTTTEEMSYQIGQMSAVETRQMSTIATGLCPVLILYICLVSTADICPVAAADICPVSTADICPVTAEDIYPVSTEDITAAGRRPAAVAPAGCCRVFC